MRGLRMGLGLGRGQAGEPPPVTLVTSVTQGDTTFTFSKGVQAGQYWNGDWWVVADPTATITSVTPNSVDSSGRILHGLMKDPYMGAGSTGNQGFDSSVSLAPTRGPIPYTAALNIDPSIHSNPAITLTEGSYVKAESLLSPSGDTRIKRYTVLTVVPSAPAANAFRPGIRAASKVLAKTTANIDWTLRRNITGFTPVADLTVDIDKVKATQWTWAAMQESQRGYFPSDGLDVYGANWGDSLSARMLAFHGEYSQAQLEETVHSIVQIGIDLIAGADDGLNWNMEEGHHVYRKFPALMAALLLDDADMKATVNWNVNPDSFGNDDNAHYYITQTLIDDSPTPNSKTNYPKPYSQDHLGMPEWGSAIETNSSDGIASPDLRASYRVLNGLRHIQGTAWAYGTAGAEALCNPAMLDYFDRIAEILEGQYTDGLYSTQVDPPFTGNWGSTPFGATRLAQYNTLRALSARPTFVNVPEEMPAPALTAETDGTVTVAPNATNPFLAPRAATSAISSYQLRWRPLSNLTGTTTPDASIPWQVITGIPSLPYTLSGVPGNTEIRVQLRAVNGQGTGIWLDDSPEWIDGVTVDRYAARVTTHDAGTAPQNVKAPVLQIAVLGEGEIAHADPGIWVGNPAPSIAYQHQRSTNAGVDWTNIAGATSQNYTTQAADVGNLIRCAITATNATGSTTVNTASRSIVASPTTAFTPTVNSALFEPIWHYATKVIEGSGFVYGETGGSALLVNEDGALKLKEVSGANFDNVADVDVIMEFELNAVDRADAQIILRGGGDNNEQGYILGYTRATNASSTDLFIERLENGVRTRLGTTLDIGGAGIPIDTRYSIRAQAEGTNLRVKYWLTSNSEPGTWGVETTDATYASGFIGTRIPAQTITRIYKFDVTSDAAVAATAPDAFVDADWSVATGAGASSLDVTIATLPANNGAAITDVEYDLDASGTWISSGGTTSFTISGLTASTSYDVRLRAVNSVGAGTAGNTETATSSAGAASSITPIETLTASSWDGATNVERTLTFTETLEEGDLIIVSRAVDSTLGVTTLSGYTPRQAPAGTSLSQGRLHTEYVVAGATPPTSVVVPVEPTTRPVTIRVQVFRGVNASPFSVSDTIIAEIAPSQVAPAITPAHDDCFIYCVAAYNDRDQLVSSYWENLTSIRDSVSTGSGSTSESNTNIAAGELLVGGASVEFSPGTLTMSGGSSEGFITVTMALRPA